MHEELHEISLGECHRGFCQHSSGAVNATTQHAVWIHGWSLLTSKVAHKRIRVSFYCCLHLSKWCMLFFCCFMCSFCTPALLLCSTTETPCGSVKHSNVYKYMCGPGQLPASLKHSQRQSDKMQNRPPTPTRFSRLSYHLSVLVCTRRPN